MPYPESSKSPATVETQSTAVIDKHQPEPESTPTPQPQPQPSQRSKRWLAPLVGLMVILGAGFGWRAIQSNSASNAAQQAAKPQAVPVKLATIETTTLRQTAEFVGSLEGRRSVEIKPELDGRIREILVNSGDRVKAGQVIAVLESDGVQAQLLQAKAALERNRAQLAEVVAGSRREEVAAAQARLNQAQANLANAQVGAGPQEVAQARAQLESARAEADLAKERVGRYRLLRQEGAVSQDQLEEYIKVERTATASVREGQRRLEALEKGRSAQIQQLQAVVEQEQQALRQLRNGSRPEEVAQARAQVAEAAAQVSNVQAQLEDTKAVAPFAGTVGDIPVKIGDFVSKGNNITTITQNDSLDLRVSVPLERQSDLRVGLPVELLNTAGNVITQGEISFISPQVNAQSILAKATFDNSQGNLRNGQFVRARIIWNQRSGVAVPTTAISRLAGETFVFVAQPGANSQLVAVQKPVKLGEIQGNNYQVLSGVKAGDTIVTSGLLNLSNNTAIAPQK